MDNPQRDISRTDTYTSRETYAPDSAATGSAVTALVLFIILAIAVFLIYLLTKPQTLNGLNLTQNEVSSNSSTSTFTSTSSRSSVPVSYP